MTRRFEGANLINLITTFTVCIIPNKPIKSNELALSARPLGLVALKVTSNEPAPPPGHLDQLL